jgi:pimeloyl-ACP methyl ester carboxylesterase
VALATPLTFAHCRAAQVAAAAPGLECATLQVPISRVDPSLGTVALAVQRMAPSAPQAGTILLLAGGPGQAALPPFEAVLAPLAHLPALRGYGLVSFDQRGTGQSGALGCPETIELRTTLASYLAACAAGLGSSRADYTSQASVDDLEALRQALGGAPLSLLAVSYGGKVAAMYAREHPEGVARMVLDSPTPLAGADPIDSQRLRALPRVLDEGICGDGACRSFAHDPYADLVRLVRAVRARPISARIFDNRGRPETVSVGESSVARIIGMADLSPRLAELIPGAIAAAVRGDPAPLARLSGAQAPIGAASAVKRVSPATEPALEGEQPPIGGGGIGGVGGVGGVGGQAASPREPSSSLASAELFLATSCAERPLPWSPESPLSARAADLRSWIAQLPAGITDPFTVPNVVSRSLIELCKPWPPTPAAPPAPSGISSIPTLILSGDEDLRTPYEQDLTAAAGYSDAQILRIPGTGHSTVGSDRSGCAERAMIAFLTGHPAPVSCPSQPVSRVPPPPSSLSDVHPPGSRPTLAARGATAAALTVQEVVGQPRLSGGGLRGGYWSVRGTRLALSHVIDIAGVSVSGSIELEKSTGELRIRGRVSGRLVIRGTTMAGQLNGANVHARVMI